MQSNTTLKNITYTGSVDSDTTVLRRLSIFSASSVLSFVGNLVVILTVYKSKELRSSTNYFIVNMSVSDIFLLLLWLLYFLFTKNKLGYVSQFVGASLCKFIVYVSYGDSMLSLVVIIVYRFSAVMFPMRARVQNKRKRILVLLLTWAIPIAMASPDPVYNSFDEQRQRCYDTLIFNQWGIWRTLTLSLFFFLPLLIMLVLYPVILIKMRQHKVPGNANRPQAVMRRRKRNFRLTIMFIVISTAFVLSWGLNTVFLMISYYFPTWLPLAQQICSLKYFRYAILDSFVVFHAINPITYFVFCSSYRKGVKQVFYCSCRGGRGHQKNNNIELNVPPELCQHS